MLKSVQMMCQSEHAPADRIGGLLLKNRKQKITVPKKDSASLPAKKALRLAKRAIKKSRFGSRINIPENITPRIVYWPYWLGIIQTEKKRPLFGPRRIIYYAIGDAVDGGYTLTRAIPDLKDHHVLSDLLIRFNNKKEAFEKDLSAIQEKSIPKLFIFGPPVQKIESVQLIYCPFWEIKSIPKNNGGKSGILIHVNAFNGTVRDF